MTIANAIVGSGKDSLESILRLSKYNVQEGLLNC